MKYKNVVFDLYGTLVDIRTDENPLTFWQQVAGFLSAFNADWQPEELHQAYLAKVSRELSKYSQNSYPDIDVRIVFNYLIQVKGGKATQSQIDELAINFRKASTLFIKLYDGVEELLNWLQETGINIFLLSNAQSCFTLPELKSLGIKQYFKEIYISSDYHTSKPDSGFFELLPVNKEETVMIGNDWFNDIEGAVNYGIDAIYIHQAISPPVSGPLRSVYNVMDGDVNKLTAYLKSL